MKTQKLIRYRLGVSRTFPTTHKRKGEKTYFPEKILKGLSINNYWSVFYDRNKDVPFELLNDFIRDFNYTVFDIKLHTIRSNYPLWAKRMAKVQVGLAVIELFYWEGKPYNSKQIVFAILDKDSGCGVQELTFSESGINYPIIHKNETATYYPFIETLAKNDGLSIVDFKEWFRKYDLSKPLAIIHLTKFRY